MTGSSGDHDAGNTGRFSYLDELHLGGIERRIAAGEYVDGAELADALGRHGQRPIPEPVLDYLCRYLKDEVDRPSGRPAMLEVERRRQEMFVRWAYRRNLAWLQKRKKRYGDLKGWSQIQGSDFWVGPPSEKAARMAAFRFWYGARSWRTVVNLSSSRK